MIHKGNACERIFNGAFGPIRPRIEAAGPLSTIFAQERLRIAWFEPAVSVVAFDDGSILDANAIATHPRTSDAFRILQRWILVGNPAIVNFVLRVPPPEKQAPVRLLPW